MIKFISPPVPPYAIPPFSSISPPVSPDDVPLPSPPINLISPPSPPSPACGLWPSPPWITIDPPAKFDAEDRSTWRKKPRGKGTVASVMAKGSGTNPSAAITNAINNAAKKAAKELLDDLRKKGI